MSSCLQHRLGSTVFVACLVILCLASGASAGATSMQATPIADSPPPVTQTSENPELNAQEASVTATVDHPEGYYVAVDGDIIITVTIVFNDLPSAISTYTFDATTHYVYLTPVSSSGCSLNLMSLKPNVYSWVYGAKSGTCIANIRVREQVHYTEYHADTLVVASGSFGTLLEVPISIGEAPSMAASWNQATGYYVAAGSTVNPTLNIDIPAGAASGTFSIPNPLPGEATLSAPESLPDNANCTVNAPEGNGDLSGTFQSLPTDNSSCSISFAVAIAPSATVGTGPPLAATVSGIDGSVIAPLTVIAATSAGFSETAYRTTPGGAIPVSVAISIPAYADDGTYTIANPLPGEGSLSTPLTDPNDATCTVTGPDLDGNLTGGFTASDVDRSCIISFNIIVATSAAPGAKSPLAATVSGVSPDPSASLTINELPIPLVIDVPPFDLAPGQTLNGMLSVFVTGGQPPYQFTQGNPPAQGSLSLNTQGQFTYIANIDATDSDTFGFTVIDAVSGTDVSTTATQTGTVVINIIPVASSPTPPLATATPTESIATATSPAVIATATSPAATSTLTTSPTETLTPSPSATTASTATNPALPPPSPTAETTATTGQGSAITTLPATGGGKHERTPATYMALLLATAFLLIIAGWHRYRSSVPG